MSKTISLTPTQLDQANLALDRATAIMELVSDCGGDDPNQDVQPTRAVFIVANVVKDELDKVRGLLNRENEELEGQTATSPL